MREGLLPNSATYMLRFDTQEHHARHFVDIITELFDPEEVAASAFELAFTGENWRPCPWGVEAYFASQPDEDWVRELIANTLDETTAQAAIFSPLSAKDWVGASLEGLKPVEIGRFVIHGEHDALQLKPHQLGIHIEAALAFGTGHHGTTQGCLELYNRLYKRTTPRHILDIGTGTGVLALAVAKHLHTRVIASDIDPVCVETTRQNAKLNHLSPFITPLLAKGTQHPTLQAQAPYDLIFANILAKPLRGLAPHLRPLLQYGGHLILSGLLGVDVPGVLSAYRTQGFYLQESVNYDGWRSLLLSR